MAGLAVCGVMTAALVIVYGEYSRTNWVPPARWVGLAAYTLLVFGIGIREFRRSWRSAGFWAMLAALLAVHLAAYTAVLTLVPEWRLIWFFPITVVEGPVLVSILYSLGYSPSPFNRRRRDNPRST
jgi:hypothetical protein